MSPSGRGNLLRRAANTRNLAGPVIRGLYRITVHGLAELPVSGPVLIVGHCPDLISGLILKSVGSRPIQVIGPESMDGVIPGQFVRFVGDIPRGTAGIQAARAGVEVLRDGGVLAVLGDRPPVGYLTAVSSAPVVPVVILGASGRVPTDPPPPGARISVHLFPARLVEPYADPCALRSVQDAGERVRQFVVDAELQARAR
jgi:1-acyl-sn-glycerol-3-phosphate acyltransferase